MVEDLSRMGTLTGTGSQRAATSGGILWGDQGPQGFVALRIAER